MLKKHDKLVSSSLKLSHRTHQIGMKLLISPFSLTGYASNLERKKLVDVFVYKRISVDNMFPLLVSKDRMSSFRETREIQILTSDD